MRNMGFRSRSGVGRCSVSICAIIGAALLALPASASAQGLSVVPTEPSKPWHSAVGMEKAFDGYRLFYRAGTQASQKKNAGPQHNRVAVVEGTYSGLSGFFVGDSKPIDVGLGCMPTLTAKRVFCPHGTHKNVAVNAELGNGDDSFRVADPKRYLYGGSRNLVNGEDGADVINGTRWYDGLEGGAGNDTVNARDGQWFSDDVDCGLGSQDSFSADPDDRVWDCEIAF